MRLVFSAAIIIASTVLGAAPGPAAAQTAPVAQPQTTAPTPVARPRGAKDGCAWKQKNLTS